MLKDNDPRGTVEELSKLRMDLVKIHSCSRRRRDEDNKVVITGCPVRSKCELPEKDGKGKPTSGCNGHGPCGKGLEVIKVMPDGKRVVTHMGMWCFHVPGYKRRVESRGYMRKDGTMEYGVVRIIADEGEKMNVAGSKVVDETIPGEGVRRIIVDEKREETVRKFPRPGTTGNMPDMGIAAEVIERVRKERVESAPARLLGIEDDDGNETP